MLMTACATSAPAPTDAELIDALTEEFIAAAKAQDIDKMMTFVSEDFSDDETGDKEGLRSFLENVKGMGFLDDLEIDLTKKVTTITGDKASGGPALLKGSFGSVTLSLEGAKEKGVWKITKMDYQM
jgi:ketosteroid isomerase-like protein